MNVTGNQDICYYNFLCAHPLGALRCVSGFEYCTLLVPQCKKQMPRIVVENVQYFDTLEDVCVILVIVCVCVCVCSAFNNILSNLGYVMLGLLFLLIVLLKDILHNRALMRNAVNALVR